jgi:hypothetical protein
MQNNKNSKKGYTDLITKWKYFEEIFKRKTTSRVINHKVSFTIKKTVRVVHDGKNYVS